MRGHAVGDEHGVEAKFPQRRRRQPRALQIRARFGNEDAEALAAFPREGKGDEKRVLGEACREDAVSVGDARFELFADFQIRGVEGVERPQREPVDGFRRERSRGEELFDFGQKAREFPRRRRVGGARGGKRFRAGAEELRRGVPLPRAEAQRLQRDFQRAAALRDHGANRVGGFAEVAAENPFVLEGIRAAVPHGERAVAVQEADAVVPQDRRKIFRDVGHFFFGSADSSSLSAGNQSPTRGNGGSAAAQEFLTAGRAASKLVPVSYLHFSNVKYYRYEHIQNRC